MDEKNTDAAPTGAAASDKKCQCCKCCTCTDGCDCCSDKNMSDKEAM